MTFFRMMCQHRCIIQALLRPQVAKQTLILKLYVGNVIPKRFYNPGISRLNEVNLGIPGFIPELV